MNSIARGDLHHSGCQMLGIRYEYCCMATSVEYIRTSMSATAGLLVGKQHSETPPRTLSRWCWWCWFSQTKLHDCDRYLDSCSNINFVFICWRKNVEISLLFNTLSICWVIACDHTTSSSSKVLEHTFFRWHYWSMRTKYFLMPFKKMVYLSWLSM